uniref:Uncharacterized protein n=1 Tax=Oryza nivara TaxID=4536 RepID=A0A0E0GM48_ORYNI
MDSTALLTYGCQIHPRPTSLSRSQTRVLSPSAVRPKFPPTAAPPPTISRIPPPLALPGPHLTAAAARDKPSLPIPPDPSAHRRHPIPQPTAAIAPPSLRLADLLRQRAAASSTTRRLSESHSRECLVVWDNKLNWIRQGHQFPPRRSCGAVDTVERLFHLRCPCCHPRPHCISVLDLRLSLTTIQEKIFLLRITKISYYSDNDAEISYINGVLYSVTRRVWCLRLDYILLIYIRG